MEAVEETELITRARLNRQDTAEFGDGVKRQGLYPQPLNGFQTWRECQLAPKLITCWRAQPITRM